MTATLKELLSEALEDLVQKRAGELADWLDEGKFHVERNNSNSFDIVLARSIEIRFEVKVVEKR